MKSGEQVGLVSAGVGWRTDGQVGVALMLSAGAIIETDDGEPRPGVALLPSQARELAFALLCLAEQVANESIELPPRPERLNENSFDETT